MYWTYGCPKCHAMLNPRDNIVLVAEQNENRMLVGFHPQPGNYDLYLPPDVELKAGEEWFFFCPVCQKRLVCDENDKMCALELHQDDGIKKVLFSRVAGEHATFLFNTEGLEEHHGEDARLYLKHMLSLHRHL